MIPEQVLDFVVQKTKLFHKNVRVEVVDVIKRNAAGKVILN
jgi:long-chain acyl-CoA synthetase